MQIVTYSLSQVSKNQQGALEDIKQKQSQKYPPNKACYVAIQKKMLNSLLFFLAKQLSPPLQLRFTRLSLVKITPKQNQMKIVILKRVTSANKLKSKLQRD